MVVEVTVATVDPAHRSCVALVRGQSTSISGDSPVVRDLAISWNPRGGTFGLAPRSSSSWGAGSGDLPGEAELEVPLRAHCSSSRWHWTLFCQLELQLWQHCLRSPRLEGILPTEGTIMRQMYFDPFQIFQFCQTPYITSCFQRGGRIGWLIHWCSRGGVKGHWPLLWFSRGSDQSSWHVIGYRRYDSQSCWAIYISIAKPHMTWGTFSRTWSHLPVY